MDFVQARTLWSELCHSQSGLSRLGCVAVSHGVQVNYYDVDSPKPDKGIRSMQTFLREWADAMDGSGHGQ